MYFKYLIVGFLNTIFGYGVFSFLIYMNFHYSVAVFLATILGVLFNFKSYGKFVFENNSWKNLWKFVVLYTILYLINIALIYILSKYGLNIYLSGLLALIPIVLIGYIFNKRFVYEKN